jgi:hypothetical protein
MAYGNLEEDNAPQPASVLHIFYLLYEHGDFGRLEKLVTAIIPGFRKEDDDLESGPALIVQTGPADAAPDAVSLKS